MVHELNKILFELLRSQHLLLKTEVRSRSDSPPDEKSAEVAMPQFMTHRLILDQLNKLKSLIKDPQIDEFIQEYTNTLSKMYGNPISGNEGGSSIIPTRTAEVRGRRVEILERLSGLMTSLMQFVANETEGALMLGYWSFADTLFEALSTYGWVIRKLPPILESNEEPPAWRARAESGQFEKLPEENFEGPIDFESVLGIYRPDKKDIVIYRRGVLWTSDILRIPEAAVFSVVAIHELAHWAIHRLGPSRTYEWDTDSFNSVDADTHEMLAQLMTNWVAVFRQGAFRNAFERLNQRQSLRYKRFRDYTAGPATLLPVLDSLRSRGAFDLGELASNGIEPAQQSNAG